MLAIVAVIWGIIVYRLFFKPKDVENDDFSYPTKMAAKKIDTAQTFDLIANYRDPFLKTIYKPVIKKDTPTIKKVEPKPTIKQAIYWPVVQYKGLISSKSAKLGVAIVNYKQHLVMKGDNIDNIMVVNLYPDSIKLKIEKETKTFFKK
jgi:hypothetical protein